MNVEDIEHLPWCETTPDTPGLYLFWNDKSDKDYPVIDLVSIIKDDHGNLLADSDNWITWYPADTVKEYEGRGRWLRIKF